MELAIVIALILIALTFDYINGFHDAANSIAALMVHPDDGPDAAENGLP